MFPFNITNPGFMIANLPTSLEAAFLTNLAGLSYATGDILYYNGSVITRLPIGTNAHVLTVSSGLPVWAAPTGGGGGGYTNLTEFVDQTAWRLFYSNADGDVVELGFGTSGQYLKSQGATTAPTWDTPVGGVSSVNTFTGDVVLDADDIDDTLTTNKWSTAAEKTKLGYISITQAVDLDALESASHAPVTVLDSSEIDFTLVGQQITASIIAGSIDESKLDTSVNASLDLADSASQPGHTHTASEITDFDTAVAANSAVAANTAKVSNATHTGEVTGSTALVVDKTAITNKTNVTAATGDSVLISDVSDADNLKKVTIQSIINLASGGGNTFNDIFIDQAGGTSDTFGVLAGARNGSNTLFTVSESVYATGTLKVWLNGQLLTQGSSEDYVETTPASGTFTLAVAPVSTDEITVEYQKVVTNSDTIVTTTTIDELAQDAVGSILVDSSEIDFTYNDATPSITASIVAGSIDETKLDASVNASLDLADSASQPGHTHIASNITDFSTAVSANADVAANTAARHSAVSLAGTPDYLTLAGQVITLNQIDLTTDVTGDLPFANMVEIPTNRILGRSTAGTGDIEALADAAARTIMGLATSDSPQFAGINLGHATDTTITRVSAGRITVEGVNVLLAGDNVSTLTNDSGYLTSFTETDPIVGAISGIVKANGAGTISAAVAGTDYLAPAAIGTTVQPYDANLPTWPATVDATEVGYLNGVTSGIQTQIDAKPTIFSGAGAPASTPTKVGDIYIDTTGDDAYIAVGTASSADWEKSNDGAGGGSGDVVGPASATDNAVARFDTTTGKLIQNSGVTIGDDSSTSITGTTTGVDFSIYNTEDDYATLNVNNSATYLELSTGGFAYGYIDGQFNLFQTNLSGASGVQFLLDHASPSPAASDVIGEILFQGKDSAANNTSYGRIRTVITDPTNTIEYGYMVFATMDNGTFADRVYLSRSGLSPVSSNITPLGQSSLHWADLFLGTGAVINFNNGNATLTHSAGLLTSNVDIVVPAETYGAGWNGSNEVPTKNDVYDAMISRVVRVVHGATASTARPSDASYVEWVGSVEPTNAINNDTWVVTT